MAMRDPCLTEISSPCLQVGPYSGRRLRIQSCGLRSGAETGSLQNRVDCTLCFCRNKLLDGCPNSCLP